MSTYTVNEIITIIDNYRVYLKQLTTLKEDYYKDILGGKIAPYGIEATLPKGQGTTGDPIYNEMLRLSKKDSSITRIETKLLYIQNRYHVITDETQAIVLANRLNGSTYRHISMLLGVSPQRVHQIMKSIAKQIREADVNHTPPLDKLDTL